MTYQRLSGVRAVVSGAFVSVIAAALTIAHEFHTVQEDRVEDRDEQADSQAHDEDEDGETAGLGERRPGALLELGPGLVDVAADGRSNASYTIHDRLFFPLRYRTGLRWQ